MSDRCEAYIGGKVKIFKDNLNGWKLKAGKATYCLIELSDFNRVISLLEMPIEDAKLALGPDFSYASVIKVGLQHDSDYWVGLAISWISDSSIHEAFVHVDDLKRLSQNRGSSQRNRHLAKRELKRHIVV
ncbi:hypothetical protein DYL59_24865 [Pseudomonas kairouanensis]|uniref:Uncharacterized protein n=1 Tax=Pseudomonas kairouanensis TaxID=2293832 RepID=A0A4Z0AFT2_9PSED|nr:hypothetical protein [Pseudomonas kairouanensis]TFY85612.1 hypothetical protein DYL59_24865 [Pseudomonas kairouanensis]